MTKQQKKKLTLTELAKLDKQISTQKEILLLGTYTVKIDTNFKQHKLDLLSANYLDILRQLNELKDINIDTFYRSASLLNTLCVKYFTDIELPTLTDINSLLTVSQTLIDLGIIDELFEGGENSFPRDQIEKLGEEVNKKSKLIGERFAEMAVKSTLNEVEQNG